MIYHLALPVRAAYHLIITAILLYTIIRHGIPRTPIVFPMMGMWLAISLSAVQSSDTRMAFEFAWHWFTNLLMFLVVIRWQRQGLSDELFKAQFIAGGCVALSAIAEFFITGGRPHSIFLNISLTGAFCAALSLPCFAFGATRSRGYFILGGLFVAATLFSQSRGALLSLGVAVLVFGFLYLRSFRARLLPITAALACVLGVALYSTRSDHANGDVIRLELWRAANHFIETYPNGVGPGMFASAHAALGDNRDDLYTGAHNTLLNTGAELGGLGLAAGAVLVLMFSYLLRSKRTVMQNAILAALFGMSAHMLFDNFPADVWALLISLYAGYLIHQRRFHVPTLFQRWAFFPKWALVIFLAGYLLLLLQYDRAQYWYEQSLNTGDVNDARHALSLDPNNVLYQFQAARLSSGLEAANRLDPLMSESGNPATYALLTYGRFYQ